jgi:hypothetical protein
MVGAMTIITSFLSPYVVKFGMRIGERFKEEPSTRPDAENDDRS